MSGLLDRIRLKRKSSMFGGGDDKVKKKDDLIQNAKAEKLIDEVKKILKEKFGFPDIWFEKRAWRLRQREMALAMVREKPPEFWIEVFRWVLSDETDYFKSRVRNLKGMLSYLDDYLVAQRENTMKKKGDKYRDEVKRKLEEEY